LADLDIALQDMLDQAMHHQPIQQEPMSHHPMHHQPLPHHIMVVIGMPLLEATPQAKATDSKMSSSLLFS
jgi:hypothetical protein